MHNPFIKTLLICLLLGVPASIGLSFYTGYAGEQAVRQQLQLNQAQAAQRGYELALEQYERGWFSSRAEVRLVPLEGELHSPQRADYSDLALNGELFLRHGPILLLENDWRLGLFALRAELDEASRLGAVSLDSPVEDLLDDLLIVGQFTGDYQVSGTLPAIQLRLIDGAVALGRVELFWQGPYDQLSGHGALNADQIKFQWPGALSLTLIEPKLELELDYLQDWMLEGHSQLTSRQGVWAGPGQLPIKFSQLDWQWTQGTEQERINTTYQLNLGRLDAGPLALKDLNATTEIHGPPVTVLRDWRQLARSRRASGQAAFNVNEWLAVADERLRQELRAEGTIGAKVGQGELSSQWRAAYRGLSAGERVEAGEWHDWAELLDAQLILDVSESAVTGTPLYWLFAESVDRYLLPGDNNSRRFEAVWRNGKLELNP